MGYGAAMAVKPDGGAPLDSEAAANRRWLITIMITIVFGGFGAVIAYLNYARNSAKPSSSSPRSPSTSPATPSSAPPAAEPSSDDKGKGKKDHK